MTITKNPANLLKQLFTDNDNETYDTTRTIFVLSWIFAVALQSYITLVKGVEFKIQDFGIGMGALTTAFGLSKMGEGKVG